VIVLTFSPKVTEEGVSTAGLGARKSHARRTPWAARDPAKALVVLWGKPGFSGLNISKAGLALLGASDRLNVSAIFSC
jgi:hypothetical protein